MIHSFAILKEITMTAHTLKTKKLSFWLSLHFFCLYSSTSLSLVGTNWLEPIQINPIGKRGSKKSVAIFIYSHDPLLLTCPACKHYHHSAGKALPASFSTSQLTHSGKSWYPQAAQTESSCSPPHHLAATSTPSNLSVIKKNHINPNLPCNLCSSQLVLWGASIHYNCLFFIPLFILFLNFCSNYLLSYPQSQEAASHLSYSFTPSQIG